MLTGKVIEINFLDLANVSKIALVINQHAGVHPDNLSYIRDQYNEEEEFKQWYDEDNYTTFYLSDGTYLECDEMTGITKLNSQDEVDYDVKAEFIVR